MGLDLAIQISGYPGPVVLAYDTLVLLISNLRTFIMLNMFRVFVAAIALALGTVALPVSASEGLHTASMDGNSAAAHAMPVIFKSDFGHMKVEEIVAIAAGAAIVGTIADMYLDSGLFTILGVTVGAALGSHWYEEGYWPFH
jgi:hypothetical protein